MASGLPVCFLLWMWMRRTQVSGEVAGMSVAASGRSVHQFGVEGAQTHRFESSATQYPFCSCRYVAPIPLEIPHDGPPSNLWEHLLYSFNVCFSGSEAIGAGSRLRCPGRSPAEEEPSDSYSSYEEDKKKLRDVDSLLVSHSGGLIACSLLLDQ
jgi:hypothetical protein